MDEMAAVISDGLQHYERELAEVRPDEAAGEAARAGKTWIPSSVEASLRVLRAAEPRARDRPRHAVALPAWGRGSAECVTRPRTVPCWACRAMVRERLETASRVHGFW